MNDVLGCGISLAMQLARVGRGVMVIGIVVAVAMAAAASGPDAALLAEAKISQGYETIRR